MGEHGQSARSAPGHTAEIDASFMCGMDAFVWGHYCIWQAVAVLTICCEKGK